MTMTLTRCENLACMCDVGPAQPTCSEFCGSPDGRDPQSIVCACGHPACDAAVERQLHGDAASENPK